jgi:hypothetical protein
MDQDDFFKIIGFIVFGMFLIYYVVKCLHLQTSIIEGLENKPDTVASSSVGIGANAAQYAENIKAITVKLHDELLIEKYGKDYSNVIIETDNLIDMLMLKTVLNIKYDPAYPERSINNLYTLTYLKNSKDALNDVMKIVDKGSSTTAAASSSFGF